MKSNKKKKRLLEERRKNKKLEKLDKAHEDGLRNGSIMPVDRAKVFSKCAIPLIPDFYRDKDFVCVDCNCHQLWTAKQQKWWYEEAQGELESTAIRCRSCRVKERKRKQQARKVHLDGLKNKNA